MLKPTQGMAFSARFVGRTDILPKTLQHCLTAVFDPVNPTIATALIKAYRIDAEATSNTRKTVEPVLNFANDVLFAQPARVFSRAWSAAAVPGTEAFLCHFNCPNPWAGPWKGYATHILDIAFVLQNYNEHLSPGQAKCAERYAKDVIAFVNGASPWARYNENESGSGAMVYDADEEGTEDKSRFVPTTSDEAGKESKRRKFLEHIVKEELFDKLLDVWQMFVASGKH